jgi:ribokinase
MTAYVTVVGSLNMDLVARASRIPEPGETIIGSDFRQVPGGKGANQAVAAARLGACVSLVGRVGRDAFGQTLMENLARDGIDQSFLIQDSQAATGVALIVVDDAGQNSIVVASGANAHLSPGDVEAAEGAIARADVLLLQLESPLETVTRAAETAHRHGVSVVLNPAPAHPLPVSLLSIVDVLIPNESETALLTEMSVDRPDEAEAAAAALLELGVGTVILTLGERGALLAQADGASLVPAFPVRPIDTTGAGDAFVGGFAVALAEGRPLAEAVRWGSAAGALATTTEGAQPSLPTRRAVATLLAGETRQT